MISYNSKFNNLMTDGTKYPTVVRLSRMVDYTWQVMPCDVFKCTITKGSAGNGEFAINSVFIPYVEMIVDAGVNLFKGDDIKLEIGLQHSPLAVEYITVGFYTVDTITTTDSRTSFTAVGYISSKLDNTIMDFSAKAENLWSVSDVINSLSTQVIPVVTRNATIPNTTVSVSNGMTGKEVLARLTSVLGLYATESVTYSNDTVQPSVILFSYKSDTYVDFTGHSMVTQPNFDKEDFTLSGVKVLVSDAYEEETSDSTVSHPEVSYTYGTPQLTLSNSAVTEPLFDAMCDNLNLSAGFTFRPGTADFIMGDARLEPFDVVRVTTIDEIDEDAVITFPMSIVHNVTGGLTTTISSTGISKDQNVSANTLGPVQQTLERYNQEFATIQKALINTLTVHDLTMDGGRISDAAISGSKIDASKFTNGQISGSKIDTSTFTDGQISGSKIDTSTFTNGQISGSVIDTSTFTNGQISGSVIDSSTLTNIPSAAIKNLDAEYAKIDLANVDVANVQESWIKDLFVQGKFVAQSGTVYQLTGLHIDANDITTGTLSADRLMLRGEDGLFYKLNVTSLGEAVVSELSETEQLECHTHLHAQSLVSNSITAEQITTEGIGGTGGYIWFNDHKDADGNIDHIAGTFKFNNVETDQGIEWDGTTLSLNTSNITTLDDGVALQSDGGTLQMHMTTTGIKFYSGDTLLATYSTDSVEIGVAAKLRLTSTKLGLLDSSGVEMFRMENLNADGTREVTINTGAIPGDRVFEVFCLGYHVVEIVSVTVNDASVDPLLATIVADGYHIQLDQVYIGPVEISIVVRTDSPCSALVLGTANVDNELGNNVILIGDNCSATKDCSISVGAQSYAGGLWSQAFGYMTTVNQFGSAGHAEGDSTTVDGYAGHAEGRNTLAAGDMSHTEGDGTIMQEESGHAGGKFNATASNVAFVLGNGVSDDERSDAFKVDWDGNVVASGTISGANPYVVSFKRSENGIWYAREWSNGVIECWSKNNSVGNISNWSSYGSGGIYYATRTIKYDFATFDELFSHQVTVAGSSGNGYTGVLNAVASTKQIDVRLIRNNNATNFTVNLRCYLMGVGNVIEDYGWTDMGTSVTVTGTSSEHTSVLSYTQLVDKPKIEDVELLGDLTYEDLNLRPISTDELEEILSET